MSSMGALQMPLYESPSVSVPNLSQKSLSLSLLQMIKMKRVGAPNITTNIPFEVVDASCSPVVEQLSQIFQLVLWLPQ
ncbi:hypothetical protein FGO68_gene507 [Halteria grandinella]|uniref:Uncharacterized protein n=1 Tax=Halteria grandinella TaxID=5974 RepID=A0A8J8P9A9_HALGN|nr:hypothetical protein FGO68_gene507 [Halteria grandinella]